MNIVCILCGTQTIILVIYNKSNLELDLHDKTQ